MNNLSQPVSRIVIVLALLASVILLSAILFMLVTISRDGLTIQLAGDVSLGELGDRIAVGLSMDEPVELVIDQPLQMVASGPNGDPIQATLVVANCPVCGGPMLPSKWNIWDGRIEWTCPACHEAAAARNP